MKRYVGQAILLGVVICGCGTGTEATPVAAARAADKPPSRAIWLKVGEEECPNERDRICMVCPPKPIERCESQCTAGDGDACVVSGMRIESGIDRPSDVVQAQSEYEKGCRLGSASACFEAARMVLLGVVFGGDGAQALSRVQDGCRRNHPPSCRLLGMLVLKERVPDVDASASGRSLIERACQLEDPEACVIVHRYAARMTASSIQKAFIDAKRDVGECYLGRSQQCDDLRYRPNP